jgi:lysophospholipase L1-like esterase
MNTLVALGDSFSCGEGVGVRVPLDRTWPHLLAGHGGLRPLSVATPGARIRTVLEQQLPFVPRCRVATLLIGLNDVCRGSFSAERFHADLADVVDGLTRRGGVVLLARLHDPTRFLWLPGRLRAVVRHRVAAVNAAVDLVAADADRLAVLDLDRVGALRLRGAWAADGVHPTDYGHVAMAAAAGRALRGAGCPFAVRTPPAPERATTKVGHARWLVRHGAPYLLRNARVFATPVAEGLRRAG